MRLGTVSVFAAALLASGCTILEPPAMDGGRWGYVLTGGTVKYQMPPNSGFLPFTPGVQDDIPGAHAASFELLGDNALGWAKDRGQVYYGGGVLTGADPKTFRLLEKSGYGADARSVWSRERRLDGADPATFRVMGEAATRETLGSWFGADKASAWWGERRLDGVDGARFRHVGKGYGTDGVRSFYESRRLEGAQGAITPLGPQGNWFRDEAGKVFRWDHRPATYGEGPKLIDVCDAASLRVESEYGLPEALDDKCVYVRGQKMPLTDRGSWELLGGGWSRDRAAVFYQITRLDGIDPEGLVLLAQQGGTNVARDRTGQCWTHQGQKRECPPGDPLPRPQ